MSDTKKREVYIITFDRVKGSNQDSVKEYIDDALTNWGHGFRTTDEFFQGLQEIRITKVKMK